MINCSRFSFILNRFIWEVLTNCIFVFQRLWIVHSAWNEHVGESNLPRLSAFFFSPPFSYSPSLFNEKRLEQCWYFCFTRYALAFNFSFFFLRECTREKKKKKKFFFFFLFSHNKIWSFDCLFFLDRSSLFFSNTIRINKTPLLLLSFSRSSSYISFIVPEFVSSFDNRRKCY